MLRFGFAAAKPVVLEAFLGSLGFGEMVIILVIVVVLFGANRLPQLGDALGKSIRNFKKSMASADEIDVTPERGRRPGELSEGSSSSPSAAVDRKSTVDSKSHS